MLCLLDTFYPRMSGISSKLFIEQPMEVSQDRGMLMQPFSLFYKLHNGKPVRRLRYTSLFEPNDKTIQTPQRYEP